MECHNQDFNQNRFLYVKDISLNHMYDELQWYEYIHTHGDTWVVWYGMVNSGHRYVIFVRIMRWWYSNLRH